MIRTTCSHDGLSLQPRNEENIGGWSSKLDTCRIETLNKVIRQQQVQGKRKTYIKWVRVAERIGDVICFIMGVGFIAAVCYLPAWGSWGVCLPTLLVIHYVKGRLNKHLSLYEQENTFLYSYRNFLSRQTPQDLYQLGVGEILPDDRLKSDQISRVEQRGSPAANLLSHPGMQRLETRKRLGILSSQQLPIEKDLTPALGALVLRSYDENDTFRPIQQKLRREKHRMRFRLEEAKKQGDQKAYEALAIQLEEQYKQLAQQMSAACIGQRIKQHRREQLSQPLHTEEASASSLDEQIDQQRKNLQKRLPDLKKLYTSYQRAYPDVPDFADQNEQIKQMWEEIQERQPDLEDASALVKRIELYRDFERVVQKMVATAPGEKLAAVLGVFYELEKKMWVEENGTHFQLLLTQYPHLQQEKIGKVTQPDLARSVHLYLRDYPFLRSLTCEKFSAHIVKVRQEHTRLRTRFEELAAFLQAVERRPTTLGYKKMNAAIEQFMKKEMQSFARLQLFGQASRIHILFSQLFTKKLPMPFIQHPAPTPPYAYVVASQQRVEELSAIYDKFYPASFATVHQSLRKRMSEQKNSYTQLTEEILQVEQREKEYLLQLNQSNAETELGQCHKVLQGEHLALQQAKRKIETALQKLSAEATLLENDLSALIKESPREMFLSMQTSIICMERENLWACSILFLLEALCKEENRSILRGEEIISRINDPVLSSYLSPYLHTHPHLYKFTVHQFIDYLKKTVFQRPYFLNLQKDIQHLLDQQPEQNLPQVKENLLNIQAQLVCHAKDPYADMYKLCNNLLLNCINPILNRPTPENYAQVKKQIEQFTETQITPLLVHQGLTRTDSRRYDDLYRQEIDFRNGLHHLILRFSTQRAELAYLERLFPTEWLRETSRENQTLRGCLEEEVNHKGGNLSQSDDQVKARHALLQNNAYLSEKTCQELRDYISEQQHIAASLEKRLPGLFFSFFNLVREAHALLRQHQEDQQQVYHLAREFCAAEIIPFYKDMGEPVDELNVVQSIGNMLIETSHVLQSALQPLSRHPQITSDLETRGINHTPSGHNTMERTLDRKLLAMDRKIVHCKAAYLWGVKLPIMLTVIVIQGVIAIYFSSSAFLWGCCGLICLQQSLAFYAEHRLRVLQKEKATTQLHQLLRQTHLQGKLPADPLFRDAKDVYDRYDLDGSSTLSRLLTHIHYQTPVEKELQQVYGNRPLKRGNKPQDYAFLQVLA